MKRTALLVITAAILSGCQYAPLPLDSSFWPRMVIGAYEYRAATSDLANKPYFDTLEVYQVGGFPFYERTLAGTLTLDPKLGPEGSITIDPALSGNAVVVRVWNAEPLDAYKADPQFEFPSPNAYYLIDVSTPSAPVFLGNALGLYPTYF